MADTPIRSYTKFTEDMFNKQHIMLMNAEADGQMMEIIKGSN